MPEIVDAYRGAAENAGREPGEILLQAAFSWARDDDEALEERGSGRGAQPDEFYVYDWHDPGDDGRPHEQLNSGADPLAAIDVYGHQVLPRLNKELAT